MKKPFKETLKIEAHHYLDYEGNKIDREAFLEENREWHSVMFYVYGGFYPMRVAVLTDCARGFHAIDYGEALGTLERWLEADGREPLSELDKEQLIYEDIRKEPVCCETLKAN